MQRILVTGGTGMLGRVLTQQLIAAGHQVRVMSRRVHTARASQSVEYVQADIATNAPLFDAVDGVDMIIHAASQATRRTKEVDVDGTRRLLEAARIANVRHFVYVSIVGIDHIPVAYYRHKLAAETLVAQSSVPWSIQRATQFHPFLDHLLQQQARWPVLLLPTDFCYQPIDLDDVARRLCDVVADPVGRLPDIGGPEVLTVGELARIWLAARGKQKPILHLPLPGATARAFRAGAATCPQQRIGAVTWADWLKQDKTTHLTRLA